MNVTETSRLQLEFTSATVQRSDNIAINTVAFLTVTLPARRGTLRIAIHREQAALSLTAHSRTQHTPYILPRLCKCRNAP